MCWLVAIALSGAAGWFMASLRGLIEAGGDTFSKGVAAMALFVVGATAVVALPILAVGTAGTGILGGAAKALKFWK